MSSAGEEKGGGGVGGVLCLAPRLVLHPVKLNLGAMNNSASGAVCV